MEKREWYPLPPQHKTAIRRVRRICSEEKAEKIDTILTSIDNQAFDNLTAFSPLRFPGVIFPYTKVSFTLSPETNVSEKKNSRKRRQPEKPIQKILELNLNGFATPPNGHPLTQDLLYNRIFDYIKNTKEPTEVTIVRMGQVSGLGGKTTKEFNKAIKKDGFSVEGEVMADFVSELLAAGDVKDNCNVVFYGKSMGAIKAQEAYTKFESDIHKRAELEKPPRIPALSKKYQPHAWQILVGFAFEGLLKRKLKALKEEIVTPEYSLEVKNIFEEKGIDTTDSLRERMMKTKTVRLNVSNILKSKLYETKEYPSPVHVQAGALDPLNFSVRGLRRALMHRPKTEGNVHIEFSMATHSSDRYRIEDWVKAVNRVNANGLKIHVPLHDLPHEPHSKFEVKDKISNGARKIFDEKLKPILPLQPS